MVQNLEEMSRRWRGHEARQEVHSADTVSASAELDLAGRYALQLREYHAKCQEEPQFANEIMSYSGADVILSPQTRSAHYAAGQGILTGSTPASQTGGASRVTWSEREEAVTPMHFPRNRSETAMSTSPVVARPPSAQPQMSGAEYAGVHFRPGTYDTPGAQNNYGMTGDMLAFGHDFVDMDRVITSNGADFSFYGMNEFGYGYHPQ